MLIDGIYFLYGCKLYLHRCFCFICSFCTFWLFNLYLYIQHKHDYVCEQWTGQLPSVRVTIVCCFLYFTLQKPLLFYEVIIIMYSTLTLLVWWQEGHPAVKMGDGGGGHSVVQIEWHPAGQSVCLPLLIFPCTIKSRSSRLAPAHPGGPGKRAVKCLWWWYYYVQFTFIFRI